MATPTAHQKGDEFNMSFEEDEKNMLIKLKQSGVLKGFMKLSESKPQVIQKICADCEPDFEQPLDYIEDFELRRRIFEDIYRISVQFPGHRKLNLAALGVFMVAPIPQLENFLHEFQEYARNNQASAIANAVFVFVDECSGISACTFSSSCCFPKSFFTPPNVVCSVY
jgi:hypothetical protein